MGERSEIFLEMIGAMLCPLPWGVKQQRIIHGKRFFGHNRKGGLYFSQECCLLPRVWLNDFPSPGFWVAPRCKWVGFERFFAGASHKHTFLELSSMV
jgi:hypothetical protein